MIVLHAVHAGVVGDGYHGRSVLPFAGDHHHAAEQVWPPLGLERFIAEGLIDAVLVGSLHVIDQRTILQSDEVRVSLNTRIGLEALHLHRKLELNRVAGLPTARDDRIAIDNVWRERLSIQSNALQTTDCRRRGVEHRRGAVGHTNMHAEGLSLLRFDSDGDRTLPWIFGLLNYLHVSAGDLADVYAATDE